MEIRVQLVSRAASEKLSMKYSDLSAPLYKEVVPEPKRLSLQSFLISNYANSPRRRLSVDDTGDKTSPSGCVFTSRRSTELYSISKSNDESFFISLTPITEERFGSTIQLRNCTPGGLTKKSCTVLPRSKTYEALSWKYKLFYLCGVSNIDMVDNYVTLPRSNTYFTNGDRSFSQGLVRVESSPFVQPHERKSNVSPISSQFFRS